MYAVLKTGGKQYKVSQNDVIIVERLNGESGSKINLDKVLMIGEGKIRLLEPHNRRRFSFCGSFRAQTRRQNHRIQKEKKKKLSANDGTPPRTDSAAHH